MTLNQELYARLRTTLLQCGEFDNHHSLRAIFVIDELRPFRDDLPQAASKSERVDACLDYLLSRRLSDGRPALLPFIAALRDRYQPGDFLRDELEALVDDVRQALVSPDLTTEQPAEPVAPAPPSPSSPGDLWGSLASHSVTWFVAGVVFVVIIAALFFQALRCVLEFRLTEATVALIALLAVGAGMTFKITPPQTRNILQSFYGGFAVTSITIILVMVFLPPPSRERCFDTSTPTPTPTETPTPTPTPTPTATPTPTLTPTPTCPYQGDTVADTITLLIQAEAEALHNKDITIIETIFARDAVIQDAVTGELWCDPITRYTSFFAGMDSVTVEHFGIQPAGPGVLDDVAWFTSGNTTTLGAPQTVYANEPGSDHWTFRQDDQGCWVITNFTFNASHVPFPPPTPAPATSACFCQSATNEATLCCLIQAESEAANDGDLGTIGQVFAPNATILRGDTQEPWDNPIAYYAPTFTSLVFTDAAHFDIHIVRMTEQKAWLTSGSAGYYAAPGETPNRYKNENPSEHWTFVKNEQGCWLVSEFEFNASHIPFP